MHNLHRAHSSALPLQASDEGQDGLHRDDGLAANVSPVDMAGIAQVVELRVADRQEAAGFRQIDKQRRGGRIG